MTIKYLTTALAVTVGLLVCVSTAHVKKPLDVDCDLLAATIVDVDVFLDTMTNIQFDNVGDLVSSAILDDDVFNDLNALISLFSGGAISFDSASQAVSTIAKCGLVPLVRGEIAD